MNEGRNPNRGSTGRGSLNRALIITLLVSIGLHLAAVVAVLLLPHGGLPVVDAPEKLAEVELVMEEHKGEPVPAAAPNGARTPAPAEQPAPKPVEAAQPPPPVPTEAPPPPAPVETAEPPTPPVETAPETPKEAAAADPAPERTATKQEAPPQDKSSPAAASVTVTLNGTDSPSDAVAWGDRVLPAAPDALFHNRPPRYPDEAVRNGQHGTVVLMIHVAPSGRIAAVDVMRSSGYVLLDQAASEAVARWRFVPALKGGEPVASEMTMGFVFDY